MLINGKTNTIGLIGCPVEHTLSPVIHNTLSENLQVNYAYLPFHVEPGQVEDAIKGAFALHIQGLNVTVPHKQSVIPHLVEVDEVAKVIGAVNTLVRVDGGYKGYNTDMEGLRMAVLSEGICLEGQTVVVLGAGGASKAVVYMCLLEKADKVYLLNRTVLKAQEIAEDMNAHFGGERVIPMPMCDYDRIPEDKLYVFQATSIGLHPHDEDVVIEDMAFYQKVEVGFDLIYNPANTRFMQLVKAAGGQAYNGLKMLLYQGVIAYGYWVGKRFEELKSYCDSIYEKLYHAIHKQNNVVLIGFMGSGKSTIGKALAHELRYEFLDTDEYIVALEGMEISDIFAQKGESYFRALETKVLRDLLENRKNTIIATGGGMPLRQENADLLRLMGTVVYLKASAEETYVRLKGDTTRPLLQCENPCERIQALLSERMPIYERVAHKSVMTDGCSVEALIQDIMNE